MADIVPPAIAAVAGHTTDTHADLFPMLTEFGNGSGSS